MLRSPFGPQIGGPRASQLAGWQVKALARDSHWGHVPVEDYTGFERVLRGAHDERPVQRFLQEHPHLLAAVLLEGHTRVVRSQVRLGSSYVMDFAVADVSSAGMRWVLVELESPTAAMFRKDGEYAEKTRHALHQIATWRRWIVENRDFARRAGRDGPRLIGVHEPEGLVLVGRRAVDDVDDVDADPWLRQQTEREQRCQVHTYDWLLERLAAAIDR